MYSLLIKPDCDEVKSYYKKQAYIETENSGYDLFVPEDIVFKLWETKFVDHKIKCEMNVGANEFVSNSGYYLYPRSSISKTSLRLCNSIGIIDAGYRGNIIAALQFIPDGTGNETFTLKKGTRIVQICSPSLQPFNVEIVEKLSESKRAEGGFGSTGDSHASRE
jgi:dUTP pyrophosphatase